MFLLLCALHACTALCVCNMLERTRRRRADCRSSQSSVISATSACKWTALGSACCRSVCCVAQSSLASHCRVQMSVDLTRRTALDLNLDISFPALPCAGLSVDAIDEAGSLVSDNTGGASSGADGLHKMRLDATGGDCDRLGDFSRTATHELVSVAGGVTENAHWHLVEPEPSIGGRARGCLALPVHHPVSTSRLHGC